MEQGKVSLIEVDECQLNHVAVVDNGASFPIPTYQNISSGQQWLETQESTTTTTNNKAFSPKQVGVG
uniref:Uncharacterized protein n=1 Tax=Arundo donax TaxID=35708 RepID=A0A0A9FCC1_ARUDO